MFQHRDRLTCWLFWYAALSACDGTRSATVEDRPPPVVSPVSGPKALPLVTTGVIELEVPTWLQRALQEHDSGNPGEVPCKKPLRVNPIAALAAPGRKIVRCCDSGTGEFGIGCAGYRPCVYLVSTAHGWTSAATQAELAAALGPPTSAAQALGRIDLVDYSLLTPETGGGSIQRDEYEPYGPPIKTPVAVVERTSTGYTVRATTQQYCGCDHAIELTTFDVSAGRKVTRLKSEVLLGGPNHCLD